jgi:serine/threonine protein kinase
MAKATAISQPANDSEREAIAFLRDHLPNSYTIIHNFELRQGVELYEIDIAILAPHGLFVVDVKGTRGLIDVYGSKWYPEGRAPYHSPLAILRKHAKALKSIICDSDKANTALRQVYVDAAVILTAHDVQLVDPVGIDSPSVVHLAKSAGFFQDANRVPSPYSRDIRALLGVAERAITGRAKPRSASPCFGNWQVEERLGGNDRYTEYRARHVLFGDRRGGTARLRVYQVDPYLPADERKRERDRIGNAFRSVANLPGHPNILTVREFFATEAEDRLVLVTEDVAGHALRQHIKKATLALTYDQKISVVRDILSALDHAHRSEPQVIHRNLTPDAILISQTGRALLTAFEYARAGVGRASTIADQIVDDLDPLYQAPECYREPSKVSVLSDLYSAGFVFYELLVGEPPFSSIDDIMDKDGRFAAAPSQLKPELPPALDSWLQQLCAFDPEDRFPSAAVARDRFNEIVGPDPREAGKARAAAAPKTPPSSSVDYTNLQQGFELGRRFRVEERLGRPGGFAVAYKVFDSFSDTSRVLKLVVKDRRSTFERLKQEYKTLLALKPHPNVVSVVWADQLGDETPYIVFEYLPGFNVEEMIEGQALSTEDCLRIAKETALGLEHLHASGVFHRDIKPSNLLWTNDGIRIIDFNVALRIDDPDGHQGGTRRYLPPDLDPNAPLTSEDEADRDVYALGITLFECLTGAKYPWDGATPPAGVAPRPPEELVSDISPEFSALIQKALAPRGGDRFQSAAEFVRAVEAIPRARKAVPPPILPSEASVTLSDILPAPKPNTNPFVAQLVSMYSQSKRTNAGTRGLDEIGKQTYIPTLLDTGLRPAVLSGTFRLVVISGNAGDGKTAFIQQLEDDDEVRPAIKRLLNGATFRFRGRTFLTNYDGSQDEETKLNDEVLLEFFGPFRGDNDQTWPAKETRIIAINEGRLIDFLSQHEAEFRELADIVRAGFEGAAPRNGVVVVNLNLRAVVANPADATAPDSIFDRLLRRLVNPNFWEACGSCDLRERCYVRHNAVSFQDSVAGPKVAERLKAIYTATHLRGKLHITMRDLRSALAFTLTSGRNCDEVHSLYASSSDGAHSEVLDGYYFNSWRGGRGSADRLLSLLQEIDIGEASNPDLDRALDYLPPDAREMARFAFSSGSNYDNDLLQRVFRELPRDSGGNPPRSRIERHQEYVSMLRRRHFFERRDEGWTEMLPYQTAIEFWKLVTGQVEVGGRLRDVLMALNRGEGLSDPGRLGDSLALRVRVVERGTIRSFRIFSGKNFELRLPGSGSRDFIEHVPQAIALVYKSPGGQSAELAVNLDVYEMLMRLNQGYRPNLEEQQGYYLSLSVFKNVLASAPYQEVLLTRTGYEFLKIRRDMGGRLHLEEVRTGGTA